jgi:hypothetical protein
MGISNVGRGSISQEMQFDERWVCHNQGLSLYTRTCRRGIQSAVLEAAYMLCKFCVS